MEFKLCPLLSAGKTSITLLPCCRERCAWWDKKQENCAMMAISELYKLYEINDSLENIGDMLKGV